MHLLIILHLPRCRNTNTETDSWKSTFDTWVTDTNALAQTSQLKYKLHSPAILNVSCIDDDVEDEDAREKEEALEEEYDALEEVDAVKEDDDLEEVDDAVEGDDAVDEEDDTLEDEDGALHEDGQCDSSMHEIHNSRYHKLAQEPDVSKS